MTEDADGGGCDSLIGRPNARDATRVVEPVERPDGRRPPRRLTARSPAWQSACSQDSRVSGLDRHRIYCPSRRRAEIEPASTAAAAVPATASARPRAVCGAPVTATQSLGLTESPDVYGAFPRLSDEQIAALETVGERRRVKPGDVLYREGEGNCDFFVILEGKVAIVEESGAGERVIGVHGPRRFLGELGLVTGQAVFVSAVVREPGQVLVVPQERLREIVTARSGARRSDPAGPDHAPLDPDRAGDRLSDRRLALLARHAPPARLRDPQSASAPLGRPRVRSGRRGDPQATGPGARGVSDRAPRSRPRAAQPEQRGARPRAGPAAAERIGGDVRSDRRRGRPGRPGGRGVRRLGRARDGRAGVAGDRRAGGNVVEDRELPRLPGGDLGRGAGGARDDPGAEVRGPDHDPRRGRRTRGPRRHVPRRACATASR